MKSHLSHFTDITIHMRLTFMFSNKLFFTKVNVLLASYQMQSISLNN